MRIGGSAPSAAPPRGLATADVAKPLGMALLRAVSAQVQRSQAATFLSSPGAFKHMISQSLTCEHNGQMQHAHLG